MQATEKKTNKIWLAVLSVGVVIALILGIVALVNHGDTKANAIPTINQQVDNIKNTLPELEKVSTELKGYIDTLETTTEKLQSDLTATNTAIDALETEVYGKVDAEKTATLNQLKADKTELENKLAAANKGIKANDDAITALEATAAKLQKELDDNAEADEATKADLEADIAAINAAIEVLKSKDTSIDEKITALEDRLKKIEDVSLTTIDQQITAIGVSIDDLKEVDKEIDGYIKSLQTAAANLQSQIDVTNEKIDSVKKELSDEIDALEQGLLNELNKLKTDIEGQLATINNAIVALQAKDEELDQKIADLQTYVDNELANYATTDWATATFATLQMYQETLETIAGIELNIRNINDELKALETRMGEKIATDIEAAVNALRTELKDDYTAEIEVAVEDITSDYNAAVQTARNEIEAAYKAAIETAVATLKTDMQNWVNEQLEKPLQEIAALQANLSALTDAAATDEELAAAVAAQEKALEEAVANLTAAYKKAITDAITENNGVIDDAISAAITAATSDLQDEINAIKTEITGIKARLDALETDVSDLQDRVDELEELIKNLQQQLNCLAGNQHVVDTESEVSFVWSKDYSTCTATGVCVYCGNEATEVANGVTGENKITATFENSALEAQVVHTVTTYDDLYRLLRCGEVVTIRLDATLENISALWCDSGTTAVLDMNGYGITFAEGSSKLTVNPKSSLTLKGVGTITVDSSNSAIYYKSAIRCRGTLFIEDDITINGNGYAISFEWSGATNISGGTINAKGGDVNFIFYGDDASLTITGGTFSCDPSAYVDLENYTVIENGDGTWTVTAK